MSVKVCPECGAEYLATVEVCSDDGATLVWSDTDEMAAEIDEELAEVRDRAEAGLDTDEGEAGEPEGDQIAYELDAWATESRVHLDQLLVGEGILHVWEAGTLVVRATDEGRVDQLIEQVEVSELPTLDPEKEQVLYELDDWPDEKRIALSESLDEHGIPHGFDENGDVVVHEEDEERTETVLDQVDLNFALDGDAIAAGGDGDDDPTNDADDSGLVAQNVMTELFVAADKLMHDPDGHDGVLGMGDASKQVEQLSLPYGFAQGVWDDIVGRSVALRGLLEADDSQDDEVAEAARELRELLRQYV